LLKYRLIAAENQENIDVYHQFFEIVYPNLAEAEKTRRFLKDKQIDCAIEMVNKQIKR